MNGVNKGKGVSSIWGYQPPNSLSTGLRAQRPIPRGSLGACPDPLFEPDQQTPLLGWVPLASVCCLWYVGACTIKSIFLVYFITMKYFHSALSGQTLGYKPSSLSMMAFASPLRPPHHSFCVKALFLSTEHPHGLENLGRTYDLNEISF